MDRVHWIWGERSYPIGKWGVAGTLIPAREINDVGVLSGEAGIWRGHRRASGSSVDLKAACVVVGWPGKKGRSKRSFGNYFGKKVRTVRGISPLPPQFSFPPHSNQQRNRIRIWKTPKAVQNKRGRKAVHWLESPQTHFWCYPIVFMKTMDQNLR